MSRNNSSITQKEWQPPKKIWNPMFISIFLANMILNCGQQMSNSLLGVYANDLGSTATQVGMLTSMFAVTALILRFIAGPAINAFSPKKLFMGAIVCMSVSFFGFGYSKTIEGLMVFRLIQGVGQAFFNTCCLAIVSDLLPKDKFNSGMGYYALAQVVSMAIGPTVGVFLRDLFGYSDAYYIIATLSSVSLVAAIMVKLAPRTPIKFNLKIKNMVAKEALVPAFIAFLIGMGFTVISSFLLVYTEERGIENGSYFFTVYALSMLATRPIIGKLTDKYGFAKVSVPSVIMTALSLVLIGFSESVPMLLLAAVFNACGYGAVQPALQSLCLKAVPHERRGSGSGTYFIGFDTATLIGPTIAGALSDKLGYSPIVWCVMAIPILCAVVATILLRGKIDDIEKNFTN